MKLIVGFFWGAVTSSCWWSAFKLGMEPFAVGGIVLTVPLVFYIGACIIENWGKS